MAAQKKYPDELRERAVRKVAHRDGEVPHGLSCPGIRMRAGRPSLGICRACH
jgi:hypothetical protein